MSQAVAHRNGSWGRSGRSLPAWAAMGCVALLVAGGVAGCGQKGPLYLPERTGTVVTRPGAAAPATQGTQQPATQQPTTDQPASPSKKKPADDDNGKQ